MEPSHRSESISSSIRAWKDPFLYIAVLLNVAVHRIWFFSTSVLTYGDTLYNYPEQIGKVVAFQVWQGNGLGGVWPMPSAYPYYALYGLLARTGVPTPLILRMIFLWPIVIAGSLGSYLLVKKISRSRIGGVVASIVFNLNTFFIVISSGHITIAAAIAWFPLALYLYLEFVEDPSLGRSLLCSLPLIAISVTEFRIFYVCFFPLLLFYLLSLREGAETRGPLAYTSFFFLPVLITVLLNAYWLVPYFTGGLSGGLQGVAIGRPIFTGGTQGTNMLLNSFTLFHPMWSGGKLVYFTVHPIPLYWFLLPMAAFSALLFDPLRRNWRVLLFGVIAVVGIFLCKFYFAPFPGAYEWLYNHFPGFNAFREPSKFFFLVFLPYAVLIGCLVGHLLRRAHGNGWKTAGVLLLAALIAVPFLLNAVPLASGSAGSLFVARNLPQDYQVFKEFILGQPGFFRTLWVPTFSRWSYYDDDHPMISCVDAIGGAWRRLQDTQSLDMGRAENVVEILEKSFSSRLLKDTSVKYVVVPLQDVENDDDFFVHYGKDRNYIIERLDRLSYLERVDIGASDLVVYLNRDYSPPVFSASGLFGLDPEGDIDAQYALACLVAGSGLPMVLESDIDVGLEVADLFAPDNVVASGREGQVEAKLPLPHPGKNIEFFANTGRGDLSCVTAGDRMALTRRDTGVLEQDGRLIYGDPSGEEVLWDEAIDPTGRYWLKIERQWTRIGSGNTTHLGELGNLHDLRIFRQGDENLIPNGSFEEGLWGEEVSDNGGFEGHSDLAMSLNRGKAAQGDKSLQLEAVRRIAGTSTTAEVSEGRDYVLAFKYQSDNAVEAGFCLEFDDASLTRVEEILPVPGKEWHRFERVVTAPEGAKIATIHLYAYGKNSPERIITLYDQVELTELRGVDEVDLASFHNRFERLELVPGDCGYGVQFKAESVTSANLIANGSFEEGLWGDEVIDCSEYDEYPDIAMTLNVEESSHGCNSLQLEAARHIAGTYTVFAVEGNRDYELSFDYQSPNAPDASYYILFNDSQRTVITEVLKIEDASWQHFSRRITTPLGATVATLFVYANPSNKETRAINRYDNFSVRSICDGRGVFYTVQRPVSGGESSGEVEIMSRSSTCWRARVKVRKGPVPIILGQAYDPGWSLEMAGEGADNRDARAEVEGDGSQTGEEIRTEPAEHFELGSGLNAWILDPTPLDKATTGSEEGGESGVAVELSLEFMPQRKVRTGTAVALFSLFALVLAAAWSLFLRYCAWRRDRREVDAGRA